MSDKDKNAAKNHKKGVKFCGSRKEGLCKLYRETMEQP